MFTGDTLIAQSWLPYIISNLLPMLHRLHEGLLSYSGSYTFPDGSTAHIGTAFGHTTTVIWGKPVLVSAVALANYAFISIANQVFKVANDGSLNLVFDTGAIQPVLGNFDSLVGVEFINSSTETIGVSDMVVFNKKTFLALNRVTRYLLGGTIQVVDLTGVVLLTIPNAYMASFLFFCK